MHSIAWTHQQWAASILSIAHTHEAAALQLGFDHICAGTAEAAIFVKTSGALFSILRRQGQLCRLLVLAGRRSLQAIPGTLRLLCVTAIIQYTV